jgi:ABC-type sugar transport system permease subunit/ABC-type glycerol-3-phosphate transport system substrate-binding protein
LWNIPLKGSTAPVDLAKRRAFDAFCKKHPEIRVRALVPMKIEGPAAEGNEFLAVAGGVAPDVFYLFGRKIGDYYNQGFLAPLDSYLEQEAKTTGQPYCGINAPSSVWELCQINGKVYCVPSVYYSMAMMCRKDLFARAGVDLKTPADWDEFYRMARRLTWLPDKEPDAKSGATAIYGLHLLTGIYSGWHMLQYIWSSGSEVVQSYYTLPNGKETAVPVPPVDYRQWHIGLSDAERYYSNLAVMRTKIAAMGVPNDYGIKDLNWKLTVDNPEAVAVLEFFRRVTHTKWIRCENRHADREFDLTPEMLKSGRAECPVCHRVVDIKKPKGRNRIYTGVSADISGNSTRNMRYEYAMRIGTLEEVSDVSQVANLVALPFPSRIQEVPPAAFIAGHYLAINATQKDPRVREAAWKYIAFMTGPEAQKIRVDTYVENNLAEFIRPASLKALNYEVELSRIPPERRALWDQLEKNARVEPYCKGFQHVMTRELGVAIEAVLADKPDDRGRCHRNLSTVAANTCRRVNTLILGEMPKDVVERKARIGWIIGVVAVGLLGAGGYGTIRFGVRMHQKAGEMEGFGVQGKAGRRMLAIVLFLAPAVVTILLWGYYPLVRGTIMAFQDFKILGDSNFVGLRNFIETCSEPVFWRYLWQTLVYLVLSLAMGFFAPIILAIFLTEIPKGKILFRTIYYLPAVTTGIVTLFMWKQLLYDSTATGLINSVILYFNDLSPGVMVTLKGIIVALLVMMSTGLIRLGFGRESSAFWRVLPSIIGVWGIGYVFWQAYQIVQGGGMGDLMNWFAKPWLFKPQEFLRDPQMAMFWVILPTIWAGVGPGCLIYLAALKGIPDEQYEAAELDGAGIWSKIVNVVYPNLSALILINFVGAVIGTIQSSSNIFVMTGGGPEDVTMTVGLSIWYNAYMFLNFGLATAQAWILGAMLIGFTLYQLRLLNQMQFGTTGSRK